MLPDSDLLFYKKNGFLVKKNFFSKKYIKDLFLEINKLIKKNQGIKNFLNINLLIKKTYYKIKRASFKK